MKALLKIFFFSILFIFLTTCNSSETETVQESKYTLCEVCPKIKEEQDTLSFVREVMHFVSQNVDDGLIKNSFCDSIFEFPINQLPVDKYLELFQNNEGTLKCGGTALIMVKILLESGIDAYTYNFGFQNTEYSHVIVLVKYKNDYLIFDPYISYELKYKNENLGLLALFEYIKQKKIINVNYESDTANFDLIADISLIDFSSNSIMVHNCFTQFFNNSKKIDSTIYLVKKQRCFACDTSDVCNSFVKSFEKKLRKETSYHNFYEGMLLKINETVGAADDSIVNNKIDSLIEMANRSFVFE